MQDLINKYLEFLLPRVGDNIYFHAINGIVVFLIFLFSAKLINFILKKINNKFSIAKTSKLRGTLFSILLDSIVPIFFNLGLYFGLDEIIEGLAKKLVFSREILTNFHHVIFILIVFLFVRVALKITKIFIEYSIKKSSQNEKEEIDQSKIISINRLLSILIYSIGASIILKYFNQSIASVLAILGVGSLAIGLAAQDTISNMIAGFVIMFERPFKVGNRIKLQTGEEGDIIEIGIRSTKILDFDNNYLIIPNAELIKSRIVNYSLPKDSMRVFIDFTIPFGSDIEKIKKICIDIMREEKDLDKSFLPDILLLDLKGNGLSFRAFCRAKNYKNFYKIGESIKIKIHNELFKNKIDIIPTDKNIFLASSPKK